MKIRQGFVSNSSTTSFCILGDWVDVPTCDDEINPYEYDEDFKSLCRECGLACHFVEGADGVAVGMSPYDMHDEETLSTFKARVLINMKKAGLNVEEIDLGWIEEAYYS